MIFRHSRDKKSVPVLDPAAHVGHGDYFESCGMQELGRDRSYIAESLYGDRGVFGDEIELLASLFDDYRQAAAGGFLPSG